MSDDDYLTHPVKLTPENLQIFSLWLGKQISVPKNFDNMASDLPESTMLVYLIPLAEEDVSVLRIPKKEVTRKIILRAKRDAYTANELKTEIEVIRAGEADFTLENGIYTQNRGAWSLMKKINFELDEVMDIKKYSDVRQFGYYLTGVATEAGQEESVRQALAKAEGIHFLNDRQLIEAMDLLGFLPKTATGTTKPLNKDNFSPTVYYTEKLDGEEDENMRFGSEASRYASQIVDVCEIRKEKDKKMARIAILRMGDSYDFKLYILVAGEDRPIYNYIDKSRLLRMRSADIIEFYVDRSKDQSRYRWRDAVEKSGAMYKQLKKAYESQIPKVVRDADDYSGFKDSNKVEYREIFFGDVNFVPERTKVYEAETTKFESTKSHKPFKCEVVDFTAVETRIEDIQQIDIAEQMTRMETTVAHHLKSSKIERGERVNLAGGIIVENHVIDVMNNKLWVEYKNPASMMDKVAGKDKYEIVRASQIFTSNDMTAEEMDLETVVSRINSLIMHKYDDRIYHQSIEETPDRKKECEFNVHYNDLNIHFDFALTSNMSVIMKINGNRVGMDNVKQLLSRAPCFPTQKEYDTFIENIADIPFVAHDLLNEGYIPNQNGRGSGSPFRFRFKREGRSWFVKKNEVPEWVAIPGGFRSWLSMSVDTYNFTDTIKKFAEKLKITSETAVTIFKTARAEYAISEKRAKELLENAVKSLGKRAQITDDNVRVQGTSGEWYHVGKEDLKVYHEENRTGGTTYVCIVDSGAQVNKTDRLVSRILALANDIVASEQITTLKPYVGAKKAA